MPAVGKNVARKEGLEKVTGAAKYVDDLVFPNMLYGATVRAGVPRGRITAVHAPHGDPELVLVDHRDIPGRNVVTLIDDDQPYLAVDQVRHMEEPILLLAHPNRETLAKLRAQVRVDYEEETPLFDMQSALHSFKEITIQKGKVAKGFAEAHRIIEGEYRTGHQEQLYIEPNGVIAVPEADGGMTVYGSLQCPYYVHKALKVLLDLPEEKVRVVQAETGGGFGGKEEYPSIIAGHAALLARKAGRPVKLIYDRPEDMAATTKRHPAIVRHKTGVKRDGTITAMQVDVLMDGGAYCTLSPVVLSRGVIHAAGAYRCANVFIHGSVVMTNTPPNGAFRGFGAPQTLFAVEVHMDRVAEALGMDPVKLREKNALRPGDTTATGQKLGKDTSALKVLREAVRRSDFQRKRKAYAKTTSGARRGIGLSLFYHGSGFTGSGEVRLASRASLELTESGVRVCVGSTEIGQGTRTILAQITADAAGLPYDQVEVAEVDTAHVPDSGPTVASRTCMIVGGLLAKAGKDLRKKLGKRTPKEYFKRHGPLVVTAQYENDLRLRWDDATYRGDAYGTYGWGCDVVELELDPDTCEVRPLNVTAVQDIGKAIHPVLARGQIEGGTAQGLGWALLEEVVMRRGRMANNTLTNYIVPTTLDTPKIDAVIIENPFKQGPFGAKGVGEMPMDGPAPAVVNALRNLGLDLRALPATPERLMEIACASN